MTLLAGTVVVVSGVGPGLGRSIALQSARAGADVVLAARTASRLDEVAKEVTALGRRAVTIPTDITDTESAAHLAQAAVDAFGRVDTLVNNAFAIPPLTSVSTRPKAASAASARCAADPSSAMSVGMVTARRPSAVTSLATSSSRDAVRAASTRSAPARALCSAIDRPRPGPTPETATTVPASSVIPASSRQRRTGGRRSAPRIPWA